MQQGSNTGGQESDYSYATNASGNWYVGMTTATQDVGLSTAVKKFTTQTQDQYGNVTQVQVSNWYQPAGSGSVIRTYTNTYLNSSNYVNAHIVNRLTGSSVTYGTYTSTLSAVTYDNGYNGLFLKDAPGITAHDTAYGCPSPSGGGYC